MKVMLVAPAIEGVYEVVPKPPLGLAYIASYLERDGYSVKIIDMDSLKMSLKDLLNEIESYKPEVIGFQVLTPYFKTVCRFAAEIKKNFDSVIVVGGPHPSGLPERTLLECPHIDIAVVGEGEETMSELVDRLKNQDLEGIKGIVYRSRDKVITNPPRELIQNVDEIPFPSWHLLPMDVYLNAGVKFNKKSFSVITSRGCPYRCIFCDSHKIWKRKVRFRSPQNVIEELKELKSRYGVNHVIIQDDTFTVNKKRVIELCNLILKEKLNISWDCKGRANTVNKQLLAKMKEAGCDFISYGFESGSQEILDYTKKGITVEDIKNAVKMTKEVGMDVGGFWMMGFPSENEEHIRATVNLIKELKDIDWNSELNILVPYPGTDVYKEMKKEGLILSEDWEYYFKVPPNLVEPPIRTRYLTSKELLELKKKFDREIIRHTYQNILKKHLRNPHKVIASMVSNPRDFFRSGYRLLHSYIIKSYKRLK